MEGVIERKRRFIINFVYSVIFIGLYYFVVKYAFGYVFPFLAAAALAVFLQRPINAIKRKLHIKAHSAVSIILVLTIVVLIVGGVVLAGMVIFKELKEFVTQALSRFTSVADLIDSVENFVMGIVVKLPGGLGETVGGYVNNFFSGLGTKSVNFDFSMLSAPLSGAWNVVKGIPSVFLGVLVTVISCVFMTADYESIRDMLLGMFVSEKRKKLIHAKRTVSKSVGKLFKAYATLMLITFTEMFVGLSFLKLLGVYKSGYIAIIALVTCVVDIVPVLGTGTVLIPWAIYSLLTGEIGLTIGLAVIYAVITVLRQIVEPKLVANQVGLPAIVTIMAMFIGAKAFGTFGIIILPLTVITLKLMYDEGIVGNKEYIEKEAQLEKMVEKNE